VRGRGPRREVASAFLFVHQRKGGPRSWRYCLHQAPLLLMCATRPHERHAMPAGPASRSSGSENCGTRTVCRHRKWHSDLAFPAVQFSARPTGSGCRRTRRGARRRGLSRPPNGNPKPKACRRRRRSSMSRRRRNGSASACSSSGRRPAVTRRVMRCRSRSAVRASRTAHPTASTTTAWPTTRCHRAPSTSRRPGAIGGGVDDVVATALQQKRAASSVLGCGRQKRNERRAAR
jgi:hypothetical protein